MGRVMNGRMGSLSGGNLRGLSVGGTTRNRLGVPCFDHLQKWVRQGEMGSEGSHRGSPETPVIATTVAVKINTQMFYSIKKRV